jgi:hypothetical protein
MSLLCDRYDAIQLGDYFRVNFFFVHEPREDVIIGLE